MTTIHRKGLPIQQTCTPYRRDLMRRTWTLIAVALATFMTYLDNNIVNVALPVIQRDLHLSTAGLEWIADGAEVRLESVRRYRQPVEIHREPEHVL